MSQAPSQQEPQEQAPPGEETGSKVEKGWSPFSTARARMAWALMAIFSIIYFAVAILTSAEFAELAATMILGLPLGFYLGMGVIIAGLVNTRAYLARIES